MWDPLRCSSHHNRGGRAEFTVDWIRDKLGVYTPRLLQGDCLKNKSIIIYNITIDILHTLTYMVLSISHDIDDMFIFLINNRYMDLVGMMCTPFIDLVDI